MEAIEAGWRDGCTTEMQPDWDPDLAAACLADLETAACGAEAEREAGPCWHICATQDQ